MSESAGQLIAEVGGRDIGLATLLEQSIARMRVTEQAAQSAGAGIGEALGSGAQQATNSLLAMQQAMARQQAQSGDLTGAIETLSNALERSDSSTVQTINARTQLIQLEQRLATQEQEAARSAEQLAAAQQKAAAQAQAAAQRTAAEQERAIQQAAQAAQRAAQQDLALAQAQARASVEAGQLGQAEERLSAALANADKNTVQYVNAERQLLQVQEQLKTGTQGTGSALEGLNSKLGVLQGALGGVGIALGAQQIIQGGIELAKTGSEAQQASASFDKLTSSAGQSGSAILSALQKASGGEISDMNLQLAATRAQVLGVAKSTEDFSTLMEIARSRAQLLGSTTDQAFSDLVTGLGRGSALILDNLGILVKTGEANEVYAKSLGKTTAQLTQVEQKQALINAVLKQGRETLASTGGAVDGNAQAFQRLAASMDNLKAKAGGVLANLLGPAAEGASQLTNLNQKVQQTSAQVLQGSKSWEQYQQRTAATNLRLTQLAATFGIAIPGIAGMIPAITSLSQAQFNYAQSLIKTGMSTDQAIAKAQAMNSTLVSVGEVQKLAALNGSVHGAALDRLVNSMINVSGQSAQDQANVAGLAEAWKAGQLSSEKFQAALDAMAAAHQREAAAIIPAIEARVEHTQQMAADAAVAQAASAAILENAAATHTSAEASLVDAANKQNQAAQTALLEARTRAAVNAFLQLNPGISASGIAALVAAGKIPPLVGQLAAAERAAYAARDALLAFANAQNVAGVKASIAANRASIQAKGRGLGRGESSDAADFHAAMDVKIAAIHDAENAEIKAVGTTAQKRALANQELVDAKKKYGEYSAEAIRAETAVREAAEGGGRGGGKGKGKGKGGGAGAAKISEQQKLDNQLGDLQTQYQQKSEDSAEQFDEKRLAAARQHAQKVLDINRQYADKELAAQKSFQLSSLNSRADFYDKLTGSKDLSQKAQQQISAVYEAAQQKAAELTKNGQAKLAQEYLNLKQQQLSAEIDFQTKVQQAQESKDKAEVARLNAIQQLRLAAQAEQEKQLLEGGDDDVNARNKALGDESQHYADQQQQITDDQVKAQSKLETAADRAADKKVLAAQRSGKAIAVENKLLERQAGIYDRMNGTRSGGDSGASGALPPGVNVAPSGSDSDQQLLGELQNLNSTVADSQASAAQANAPVVAAVNSVTAAVNQQATTAQTNGGLPPGVSVGTGDTRLDGFANTTQTIPTSITQALQPTQDRIATGLESLKNALGVVNQAPLGTAVVGAFGPILDRAIAAQQQSAQQQVAPLQTTVTAVQTALTNQNALISQIGSLPALKAPDVANPAAPSSTPAPVTLPAETPKQISDPIVSQITDLKEAMTAAFEEGMEKLSKATSDGLSKMASAVAAGNRNNANRMS